MIDKLYAVRLVLDYTPVCSWSDTDIRKIDLARRIIDSSKSVYTVDEVCRMLDSELED